MPRAGGSAKRGVVTFACSAGTTTPGTRAIAWPVATNAILPGRSAACRPVRTVTPASMTLRHGGTAADGGTA